jgi:ornithine decarboxylase
LSYVQDYDEELSFTSSIWGPTCDGLDCITEQCYLPQLDVGDWIIFEDMGAYTMCAASNFNGMPKPHCYYIMHDATWSVAFCQVYIYTQNIDLNYYDVPTLCQNSTNIFLLQKYTGGTMV